MAAIVLLLVGLLLTILLYVCPKRPRGFPPGPTIWNMSEIIWAAAEAWKGGIANVIKSFRQTYGYIFGFVLPTGLKIVHIFSVDAIREAAALPELAGRPDLFSFMVRTRGRRLGVSYNEGPDHWQNRRLVLLLLRKLGFYGNALEEMIADEFDNMVKSMLPNCGRPVNMRFYLDLAAINVIWRMFTGSRLDGASPQTHEMMTLATEAFQALGPQNPVTVLPWLRHVMPRWSSHAALLRYRDSFEPLLQDLILKHRQRKDHTSPPDFMDLFLAERESTDSAGCSDSESHLIAMGMDFFEAGLTTTSVTLLWTLLLLVMHPDIQSRAQQEIDRVLNGQRPCFSDRARLPFVQAVLMEASRVASVIPQAVPHRAVADVSLRGHRIPRGTMILLHLWAVHADAAHWGDPHRFRPERFLTAEGEVRQDEHLMPFGSGRRICLGETVARTELFVLCVSLLQRFRFAAAPGQVLTLESSFFELRRPKDFSVIYETR